jgi:hypothetical protein
MKINSLKSVHALLRGLTVTVIMLTITLSECKEQDPKKEDVSEMITEITLTFTPTGGGSSVVVSATDPDGEGIQDIKVDGPVNLALSTSYTMKIDRVNGLADPGSDEYSVPNEVREEGGEHQFFFSWSNNAFSNPSGNGNIDNRADALNHTGADDSKNENGRPLGLTTTRTTATTVVSGSSLSISLKHQPDLKSDTSTWSAGETDLDRTFTLNVQ